MKNNLKQGQKGRGGPGGSATGYRRILKGFRRDWQLWLMLLLPVVYVLIFHYWPMYGVQIAFRDYRARSGIIGSEWVGLKWFKKFLTDYQFKSVLWNTVILSLYTIAVGFPIPIIFALLFNTVSKGRFRSFVQTISYIPHFFSVVVVVGILNLIFSPINGVYGNLYRLFGGLGFPTDIRTMESSFRHLYVWSGVWQEMGWGSIIYIAALQSVSQELHEAAKIDGATQLQRILHVDLPAIMPTVCIMLIMRCGSVLGIGFEKVFLLQNSLNIRVSEVISTYVYKYGMGNSKDFSYGAAVGLFESVINLALLLLVNWICKRMTDKEVSLI